VVHATRCSRQPTPRRRAPTPPPLTTLCYAKIGSSMNRNASGVLIGRILGIPIYVHASWVIIFVLITMTLEGQLAQEHPQWTPTQHWSLGIATSLLFFASVIFHELSHSVIAQAYKIRVDSITLFVFGGVARISRDPSKAIQEFNIAIAGPIASFFLAAVFYAVTIFFPYTTMPGALATWLWETNFVLAIFNLLPGFPLDGGRIFRAIVWGITKDFTRSTKVAGTSGKIVAYAMIVFGAWYALSKGQWQQGLWYAFIGWFLLSAAQESVAQIAVKETLTGLQAADVMSQEVPIIPREISLEDYGHEVLRTGRRCHLVVTDERLVGMMNVNTLNSVPRDEWAHMSVQAVMIPREKILWAAPEEPLLGLLERLLAADVNQMPVVSGGENGESNNAHIIGMITRDSILRVMRTRAEVGPVVPAK
jgi:Zn-dependent protease/predicted transcriptional regulator